MDGAGKRAGSGKACALSTCRSGARGAGPSPPSPLEDGNMEDPTDNTPLRARSFLAILTTSPMQVDDFLEGTRVDQRSLDYRYASADKTSCVSFTLRENSLNSTHAMGLARKGALILGDDHEWNGQSTYASMANAVLVRYNLVENELEIRGSIVGLPPIFLYEGGTTIVIASDLYRLSLVPGVQLKFDFQGLIELGRIGHPIDHRTLFQRVALVPGGSRLRLIAGNKISVTEHWRPPTSQSFADWTPYIDSQIEAIQAAIRKIDLSHSFLSLTAGLDTRAILALLIQEGRSLPTYTISGERISLDAMRARQLCRSYGLSHRVVALDHRFYKELPAYTVEASRLSGGLSSLEQASEVYFYNAVGDNFRARLSGYLGNQIGRSGTEGTRMRHADLSILTADVREVEISSTENHWFYSAMANSSDLEPQFLLQKEVPFSSVANFCLGNHFVVQQSPYADRALIELKFREPRHQKEKTTSVFRTRVKDLRHRFLGEPESRSFQRRLIKSVGGDVATCPINWGWQAQGGVSLRGLLIGGLALVDALVASRGMEKGVVWSGLGSLGVRGLSDFRRPNILLSPGMQEFLRDTLVSGTVKQSGLFASKHLEKTLEEHFSSYGRHYQTLVFALDVALAQSVFRAAL